MAQSHQRSRLPRNLMFGFLVLVVLYALVGFLLLPWWLERALPGQLEQRMGWQASVTGIHTNPFALSVEALEVSAQGPGGEKVLAFDRLYVNLGFFQLLRGVVGFESIQLEEPFIRVDLLEDYSVNFARDWRKANPQAAAPEPTSPEPSGPPPMYFQQIVVDGGELLFRDFSQQQPAEFRITPLDLTLNDLATWRREGRDSNYSLQAALGDQTIEWQGDLSVTPLYSRGSLRITDIGYETLAHFLGPFLPYHLRAGSISLSSDYELQAGESLFLNTRNGTVSVRDLAVAINASSEQAALTTASVAVDGIEFDLNRRELAVGQVAVGTLDIALTRSDAGALNWLAPLPAEGKDDPAAGDSGESAPAGAPFRWSVEGIQVSDSRVAWEDRQPESVVQLVFQDLSLSTGRLTQQMDEPVPYQLQASLASGGELAVNGQVTPTPFTLEAALSGSDIALAAFEPYLQTVANLAVGKGTLGIDGHLDLDDQQSPLTGTFSGTAQVADLVLRTPGSDQPMVSWQSLRLDPIEYNVHPARLEIGTVTLAKPVVNVVRGEDGQHNVANVVPAPGAQSTEAASDDPGTDDSASEEPGFIFRIGQLLLENGALSYTDRSLTPAFTTEFDELNGSVTGLSNISPQQGKVSIRGRVDGVANLDFSGTIGTLGTEDVSDLKLTVDDLSLPVLSPYFGRYLGYGVDSGKLDLNLDYQIAGTRIDATNLAVMDRLALGQPVASKEAVNAPVKLGLALLRDRSGVIKVDVPISGDLANPEFSVGKVVMRAFVNLLAKAAASPFSMLGSIADLAGLSGEELGKVNFIPGGVQLAEGEAAKLAALADALRERPDLLLNVRGGVAPEADGLALLREELNASADGKLSDEDWQRAREAYLAGERSLPPEALTNLATARGVAVQRLLRETHEVPSDQLFLLDPSRNADVSDSGEVIVGFTLDVR